MKVDFTFKHVDTSESLMEYSRDRIEKIAKFELNPMDVHFVVSMLKHECIVEVTVIEGRRKFKANANSTDFYRSVEMCVNKLSRQMAKDKRRLKGHKLVEKSTYGQMARLTEELDSDFAADQGRPWRKTG